MPEYISNNYYKSDITSKIIGCAIRVHKFLGNGFQEVVYQRALRQEFISANLIFEREFEMDIYYKNGVKIGTRRVDFLVDGDIMVELKAVSSLADTHVAQAINYIEAYKVEIGLLLNFGAKSLEMKRFIKSRRK